MANRIFNTGVDDSGQLLPPGSVDPHWALIQGPGVTGHQNVFVLPTPPNPIPTGYFASTDSGWVWSDKAGFAQVDQPYVFRQKFDLDFDLVNLFAQISARWGADNYGHITINGMSPAWSGEISLPPGEVFDNFARPHDVTISNHFQLVFHLGSNHLDLVVFNEGVTSKTNPSAFNVSGAGITLMSRSEVRQPQHVSLTGHRNPLHR
jgi:hypothetical protein